MFSKERRVGLGFSDRMLYMGCVAVLHTIKAATVLLGIMQFSLRILLCRIFFAIIWWCLGWVLKLALTKLMLYRAILGKWFVGEKRCPL